MTHILLPAVWLIVLLVGLPQLSETTYTPSFPEIARALQTSESTVEYTLTIYLFGFAIGTLFWGKLSDKIGRKPCVLAGLMIFILGCICCYWSHTIEMLMISRLIQAFGGSIGSVLGQAICRDAFHGPALGKVFSSIASALAIFPALGPMVGGVIAAHFGWPSVFLFLMVFASVLSLLIILQLPETHHADKNPISILGVALTLFKDRKVLECGLVVATCNGIAFSYFAEGSFYLINLLGLSPSEYDFSFIAIATATLIGGMLAKKLQTTCTSRTIMGYGLVTIWVSALVFSAVAILYSTFSFLPKTFMIAITLLSQMSMMLGICMAISSALALALTDYQWCIGTASSLFGFFYYCLISLFTLGMGYFHNGTLLPMPLYFLALSSLTLVVQNALDTYDKKLCVGN